MALTIITGCLLTSCFKDEPLNAECDIEKAWVHSNNPEQMFFNITDTLVEVPYSESKVTFYVRRHSDLTQLAPMFSITEGATIKPAIGSVHDFSNGPVTYTVTSEDGAYSRTYEVAFNERVRTTNDTIKFDFETYRPEAENGKYYTWYDTDENGNETTLWTTGNPGFRLAYPTMNEPMNYPTCPFEDGFDGSAVKLETRSTGPFGVISKKRIAAGNLFYGFFNVGEALGNTLKATEFGHPFDKKPIKITGYYQYTPGETYQDFNGKPVADMTDQGAIYSVLYRNHDESGNPVMLYGDDVLTSRYVVAVARMADVNATDGWTEFKLEYTYLSDLDLDELEKFGYSLTIVFSSSYEGDKFEGAVGSTLLIDKVRVVCEKTE